MSDNLILDFPILQESSSHFSSGVSYVVTAVRGGGEIIVTHTITGQSFVRQLIENGEAKFSVLLFYRDSSERQNHLCEDNFSTTKNEIISKQTIHVDFSYAPEVMSSVVVLVDKKVLVDSSSGLTELWEDGERFCIPKYTRIALFPKLKFTSGDVSKLMTAKFDEKLKEGEVKVIVNENAGEGEIPVTLLCGKGVYDQLGKATLAEPSNAVESMRWAIITQALCAVYAYMQNLSDPDQVGGVLAAHLEALQDKTGENWKHAEFNPSLAATKMHPYAIAALQRDTGDG